MDEETAVRGRELAQELLANSQAATICFNMQGALAEGWVG